MMGSGKSTVGRRLSVLTGWPLLDNDELLNRLFGLSARELLEKGGESELRRGEAGALTLGLAQPPPCIIDAAGGTILDPQLRASLADATVVWLRARPETLFRRAQGAAHRPWLDRGPEWFADTATQRAPLYESVAGFVVDTDDDSPREVAEKIHSWLATLEPCAASLTSTT
jgi:shikimate kinase